MQLTQQVVEPSKTLLHQQQQQKQDPELVGLCSYLKIRTLPEDPQQAKVISNLVRKGYLLVDNMLYYKGPDAPDQRQVVVPQHLRQRIVDVNHDTAYAGQSKNSANTFIGQASTSLNALICIHHTHLHN